MWKYRAILLITVLIYLEGCTITGQAPPVMRYHMHGTVLNLDPANHVASIKHDKIEGYMDAMTMDYPVRDADAYKRLTPGETIDATVFVQDTDFWIGEIKEVK